MTTEQDEEDRLVLDRFTRNDDWRLGRSVTEIALEQGHPVVIDIRRPDLITTGEGDPYRAGGDFDSETARHAAAAPVV
jgi:1,6-anhydro-N-acetylmuramate kinase